MSWNFRHQRGSFPAIRIAFILHHTRILLENNKNFLQYIHMELNDAIVRILSAKSDIDRHGVTALYIFGSTSKATGQADSDVDIFIDRDPRKPFGMTQFFRLQDTLADALGVHVDLATRASLHPALRDEIEKTAVRVL